MSHSATATLDAPPSAKPLNNLPIAVAATVLLLAHVPILAWHMHFLSLRPHYEFYPLVFLGAAFLAWQGLRRAGIVRAPNESLSLVRLLLWGVLESFYLLIGYGVRTSVTPEARRMGTILLVINWVMLTAAVVLNSPLLGMLSFIELMAAVAVLAGGWLALRAVVPALIFMFLIVPPPFGLDSKLVTSLQTLTSKVSSRVLDRIGVIHYRDGNTVEIGGKQYFVDTACSGINSLFSTIAVTLFCVLYFGLFSAATWVRSLLRTALLFLAAVFWVVIANVVRVTSIVWLDSRFQIDLSKENWDWAKDRVFEDYLPGPHALYGFLLFGLVLAMMYSTNQLLMFIGTAVRWGDAPAPAADVPAPPTHDSLRPPVRWATVAPALAAYGLLLAFQVGEYQLGEGQVTESQLVQVYNGWTESDLPEQIGAWQRKSGDGKFESRNRDNPFGAHSHTWRYQTQNGLSAILSFDYPFPEWHDLRICYRGVGWVVTSTTTFNAPTPGGSAELECMKFELGKPFEHRGYVWFAEFDQLGKPVPIREVDMTRPYSDVRWSARFAAIQDRWMSLFRGTPAGPRNFDVLQVQVVAENYGPLEDSRHQDLRPQIEQLFLQGTELIRAKCAAAVAVQPGH
jgi:exosortase